jgi:hypothetical protein
MEQIIILDKESNHAKQGHWVIKSLSFEVNKTSNLKLPAFANTCASAEVTATRGRLAGKPQTSNFKL